MVRVFQWPILGAFLTSNYRRASGILTLSSRQCAELLRIIPDGNICIVPNYISVGSFLPNDAPEMPEFLYLGRLSEDKGIAEIIEVAQTLVEKGLRLRVTFCGDGPLRSWLEQWRDEHPESDWFRYTGMVRGDQKESILNDADVLLLPTRHAEGFPYSLLEAFAHGLPVIATGEGALADVIKDGYNGYLLTGDIKTGLSRAMERYCINTKLVTRMGVNAYEDARKRYSLSEMQRVFSQLYAELAQEET
jgi:glycosyltransferase involved in cell wall biosynthesis